MFKYHLITSKKPISRLNKPIQNRLSIFFLIGLLLLSLLSCTIIDDSTSTHTISFKLNGGKFSNPQKTTIEVVDGETIDQSQLKEILSYPPTGPQPNDLPITREIFQWQTNGVEYDLSALITNSLTLEAVWSNSCGAVETVHPANKDELQAYIDKVKVGKAIDADPSTDLNHIDTSAITDMNSLFSRKGSFNGDFNGEISCWNTSKVTNMQSMFAGANDFNQNISKWDVSSVINMESMFAGANAFNGDINKWDVSSVINMQNMFWIASAFNGDISKWNVSSVTNMNSMFNGAQTFDQDLSGWVVDAVTSYDNIFDNSAMKSSYTKYPPKFRPSGSETTPIITSIGVTDSSSDGKTLIQGKSYSLSFVFSEEVTNFTTDDIQIILTGANAVSATKGEFTTNNQGDNKLKEYFLEVTPQATGTLYIKISDKSFKDFYGNENEGDYTAEFTVLSSTYTISFVLNGGVLSDSQTTSLLVKDHQLIANTLEVIDQDELGKLISYPATGPQSGIEAVTRDFFEWQTSSGVKYDFSSVTSDLTLEALWLNSCNVVETFHPANKTALKDYTDKAITANPTTNFNHIDTSAIADMANLFKGKVTFNGEIGCWNVSSVTNMNSMFNGAQAFNQNLSGWAVNKVDSHDDIFTGSSMDRFFVYKNYPPKFLPPESKIALAITSISVTDASSDGKTLIQGKSYSLSFVFSKKVTNFTTDDIQFLTDEANAFSATKGEFITNSLKEYSLEVTPQTTGTLTVKIPDKSFKDFYGNENEGDYTTNFTVLPSSYTVSFKPNGGIFNSEETTIEVEINKSIDQNKLRDILSYPDTGPRIDIKPVTRSIFQWRNNGVEYDLSALVTSDLTLEAVWSNSCGKVETFHPANKTELKDYTDKAIAADPTTNLNHIDTSDITYMNTLFENKTNFNGEIGCWNTTKVTDMSYMFNGANKFNQPIGNWDASQVTDMSFMFAYATNFDQPIGEWIVFSVKKMSHMFENASSFNQDIQGWTVIQVTDMSYMFKNASSFDQSLVNWLIGANTTRDNMFTGSPMDGQTGKHPTRIGN